MFQLHPIASNCHVWLRQAISIYLLDVKVSCDILWPNIMEESQGASLVMNIKGDIPIQRWQTRTTRYVPCFIPSRNTKKIQKVEPTRQESQLVKSEEFMVSKFDGVSLKNQSSTFETGYMDLDRHRAPLNPPIKHHPHSNGHGGGHASLPHFFDNHIQYVMMSDISPSHSH